MTASLEDNTSRCAAGLILLYHRVDVLECDPWRLAIKPDRFAQQLQCLRKFGQPESLGQIISSLRDTRSPRRAIAVTFDDGYADNLHNAAPLLARYDVPATVFVATGYIGSGREFWWDEIERVLLAPADLPEELSIVVGGQISRWSLGKGRHYPRSEKHADQIWFDHRQGEPSPRFAFFRDVHRRLIPLNEHERREALDQIVLWSGEAGGPRRSHMCVSRDEAIALDKQEGVELAAHSVTHVPLSAMPTTMQTWEMRQSKMDIEELTGRTALNFAYPFGLHSDESAKIAQAEGFISACSIRPGVVLQGADAFSLPRVKVGDWEGERFEKMLAEWLPPLR